MVNGLHQDHTINRNRTIRMVSVYPLRKFSNIYIVLPLSHFSLPVLLILTVDVLLVFYLLEYCIAPFSIPLRMENIKFHIFLISSIMFTVEFVNLLVYSALSVFIYLKLLVYILHRVNKISKRIRSTIFK